MTKSPPPWVRLGAITVVVGTLYWLTTEDSSWIVIVFALALSGLALFYWLTKMRRFYGMLPRLSQWILGGMAVGAMTALLTLFLMFFKNALHAHLFLDYPLPLMSAVLVRTPSWIAAGGLIGAGSYFFLQKPIDS